MKFDTWVLRILPIMMFCSILMVHLRHHAYVSSPPRALLPEGTAVRDAGRVKALAFYRKYPPPEWGYDVIKKIADRNGRLGPPITPDEVQFIENYELWDLGRRFAEEDEKRTH